MIRRLEPAAPDRLGAHAPHLRLLARALLVLLVLPSAAFAQSPDELILEGLRRQEERVREELRAHEPRASELRHQEATGDIPVLPQEADCHTLLTVSLTGPDAASFEWLLPAARPFLGHCVGARGLALLAGEFDRQLLAAGFATSRVGFPPQDLRSGQLLVHLHAGRIAAVRFSHGPGAEPPWGTWRNAFPSSPGDFLNARDLEHGLENMKRLPSQDVALRLEPGALPDTSEVVIEQATTTWRDRLRGGLSVDNGGGPTLGRAQLAAHVAVDNPLALNDLLTLSLQGSTQPWRTDHRSLGGAVQYSIPWGYHLLSVEAGHTRFAQRVPLTGRSYLSSGRSETAQFRWQRTAWRSASSQLAFHLGLGIRRARAWFEEFEIVQQRRRTAHAIAGLNLRQLYEGTSLEWDLGWRRGMGALGAEPDLHDAAQGEPTLRPTLWSLGLAWQQAIGSWTWRSSLRLQATRDRTWAVDQFAIGGRHSVRGFDGGTVLLAESGLAWRNELTTSIGRWAETPFTGLLALDHGRVWGPSASSLPGRQLAGVAAGVRAGHGELQAELTLATPLYKPAGFPARSLNAYLTVTHAF